MNNPLILKERRRIPRIIDILLTLLAWSGFIWLFIHSMLHMVHTSATAGPRPLASGLGSIALYIAIVLFNGLLLIGWAKYNQFRFRVERRRRRPGLELQEVAQSFAISDRDAWVLNRHDIMRVHHDNHGQIRQIEALVAPSEADQHLR